MKTTLIYLVILVTATTGAFVAGIFYWKLTNRELGEVESLDSTIDDVEHDDASRTASPIEPGLERPEVALPPNVKVAQWQYVPDFPESIAIFETVFWDPRDTESLRDIIRSSGEFHGKTVLEIGTGSGLLALCCLKAGAARVVATDVNHAAIENVKYNARLLGVSDRLDARLVPMADQSAYSVIAPDERFDIILSNPPWEDQAPTTIESYALYDQGFALLQSLLEGLEDHIEPGGGALLAYGCVDAIERAQEISANLGFGVRLLDDRELDMLPATFLPGMLVEVSP